MSVHEINNILNKALSGREYLTVYETEKLFQTSSYQEIDMIYEAANTLRKQLCGEVVTYTINLNVNFTNICECNCLFCGFRRSKNDKEAYTIELDELYDKLKVATVKGAVEVCYQGGLNTQLNIHGLKYKNILDQYAKLLLWTKDNFSEIITHSYSPEEIDFLSIMTGKSVDYCLRYLKDNGLDTMPGTAAEILVDEVRQKVCPKKLNTSKWIEIIKNAHLLNIPTTATIMYGHFETPLHRAQHLNHIRNIQFETKGFTEFIPLPLVATKTQLFKQVTPLAPEDRLKLLAISRLFFADTIPNIQASWVKQGMDETREALNCGVNDIGGTLGDERITYAAGGDFGRSVEVSDLVKLIHSAGKKPVLRDTYYNHLLANICVAC